MLSPLGLEPQTTRVLPYDDRAASHSSWPTRLKHVVPIESEEGGGPVGFYLGTLAASPHRPTFLTSIYYSGGPTYTVYLISALESPSLSLTAVLTGSDGWSLWVRLRVRVRLGVGCTGRGEARGGRELCACAGHQMLCCVNAFGA